MRYPQAPLDITSANNPRLKSAARLRQRDGRVERGAFGVEGLRELTHALEGGFIPEELFVCESVLTPEAIDLVAKHFSRFERLKYYRVAAPLFEKIAVRDGSCGLFAVFTTRHAALDRSILGANPFILASEDVEKPGNLGALMRSLDGAGADALIVIDREDAASRAADPFNPNATRASVGTMFRHPVVTATPSSFHAFCAANGIRVIAASPHATKRPDQVDLTGPVAIVLGSEAWGLSPYWTDSNAQFVKIPMLGHADSLNVSASGAILLYEVRRQRIEN